MFAAMLAIVSACTIAFAASAAMAAPVIDGNLTDFIAYGQSLKNSNTGFGVAITDKPDLNGNPQEETIYSDPKFIPCPTVNGLPPAIGTHWINGTEIFYHYLDYVPGSTTLYLGLRTQGFVGDSDGDNDPDASGSAAAGCNPNDNIEDLNGISGNEQYAWRFDLNCDGVVDAAILVQDNQVTGSGLFAGITGTMAFKQNGATGASGHDLEVAVNLASPLPAAFNYVRVESNAFDGLSEDRSDGQPLIGNPQISVSKSALPASICAGDKTRFTINVSNPGTVQLSVVATDVLPAALTYAGNVSNTCGGAVTPNGQTIVFGPFDLAPGASCSISFDAQSSAECFGTVTNVVDVDGTFTSPCIKGGSQTTTAHAEATVTCKAKPCVELTSSVTPAACPGSPVTVSGTVKNCSLDPETIVVKLNGVQIFSQLVAAGATQNYSQTQNMPDCTSGQQVPFNVEATATNDCPPADVKTKEQSTLCKQGPCVTTAAECNPAAACPGAPITVKGSATNCGPEAEDIVITIEGQQNSFTGVASGATVSWTYSGVMPECTAGGNVTFHVSAVATNDCGTTKPSNSTCNILCIKPQIQIDKSVSPTGAVDQGTTLHYTIVVTNPSKDVPLEDVHVSDELCSSVTYQGNASPTPSSEPAIGSGGTVAWDLGTIAPGGSATLTFDAQVITLASPACEATDLSCTNTAVATGDCAGGSSVRAEDSVTTPINPCVQPGLCRLTGGGCMNDDPDTGKKGHKQNTFGGNSSPEHSGGGPSGNSWEHILRDGQTTLFNWHSWDAHVIQCTVVPPGPCSPKAINTRADFVGTGKYSIGSGGREEDGNMVAYIIDHKEGSCNKGTRDEYYITVRKGLVIGQGDIVFDRGGFIDCGNLQIHETPARLFGNGISLPGSETGASGVTLLNRAYPNPFSGTTNFAYKVAEGGLSVEVGVYNVAGRLVKTLASGSQNAGTYTVTWDGSDDSGVRMAPGVYFLKSRVGNDQVVNRLIYVAR